MNVTVARAVLASRGWSRIAIGVGIIDHGCSLILATSPRGVMHTFRACPLSVCELVFRDDGTIEYRNQVSRHTLDVALDVLLRQAEQADILADGRPQ